MALWDSGGGARPGARSCTAGHPRLVQPGPRLRPAPGAGPTAAHAGRACHRPCWGRAGRVPHAVRGLRFLPIASAQWGECAFLGRPAEPTTASNCPQARGASFRLQAGSPPLPAPHGTRASAVPRGVAPACTRGLPPHLQWDRSLSGPAGPGAAAPAPLTLAVSPSSPAACSSCSEPGLRLLGLCPGSPRPRATLGGAPAGHCPHSLSLEAAESVLTARQPPMVNHTRLR